ncbi:MAG: NAD-dependent epimerase/dehydratase family protein [Chloroflexota bacterium]|nr:NAD-dependent epimerase/dehydratase family protein [Chloroflexota bacterium]
MKILILGGKKFLGIALVEAMLEAGHTPTLFNRGLTNPELFPKVKNLIGDREHDLSALKRRKWDAVIDTSGFIPRNVTKTAKMLSGKCRSYIFISSVSVYQDYTTPDIREDYPLAQLEDPSREDYSGDAYGPLKALCEYEIQQNFDGKVLAIRPGLIVGPNDPTERFAYWPWRVSLGGKVLVPAPPSANLQFIDVRDLSAFILKLIENNTEGVFNVTGPKRPTTFGALMVACREAALSNASFVWVEEPFLIEEGVSPWSDLPLWVPSSNPAFAGFYTINIDRALKAGLNLRPLSQTVGDTLAWLKTRPDHHKFIAGMDIATETKLLLKYKKFK